MSLVIDPQLSAMLSDRLREAIASIPPEYNDMTEGELSKHLRPTWIDQALRVSFWNEYERAYRTKAVISQTAIWRGVCASSYWTNILNDPARCAYIFRPVVEYQKSMETLLAVGIQRVNEILHMPIYDDKGRPNPKIAGVVLAAVKQVEDRVKGMAVQRVVEHQKKVIVRHTPQSLNEIDSKIKMLEAQLTEPGSETRIPETSGTEEVDARGATTPVRDEVV